MRLSRALEEKKMDVRLRDKLIAENKITKDEVGKYKKVLVDDSKNTVSTEEIDAKKRKSTLSE
jgi:hypothetical protein